MSDFKSQFNPPSRVVVDMYTQPHVRLESDKGAVKANWLSTEVCLNKCNVDMSTKSLSEGENWCLKKCYNKVLDSKLLIDREIEHYTVGNPYH